MPDGRDPFRRRGRAGGHAEWADEEAGPVVRPYALTGGRTKPVRDEFDLIAIIETVAGTGGDAGGPATVGIERALGAPEHQTILELCRSPLSVAEVASELDLPLGVVRVLLGDLLDHGLIRVRRPAPVAQFPNERVLKEVIDGLHAL
ncbi:MULTISPECIES: DUF742 domain-containing protein [Thermomonospora]|uniref:DUF742 domain-containing protein n=1 Tax=Thermomonospora curvata (strain ATCC 19995 / DSM 43183 / JCM 3096 / KCTC 9072 / NBRC 15933 / NCIMB 10081 / Henssen B9) TaxID=471852 RepID=D1ACE1_THECD|nr:MULTISPECIES: DUF742 domain-containing protein [Thermomonospora]ACY99200.1 protein of unknown function DUF742 [Thermomonospora curvata DSM 43183]PKK13369.1 MAG: DUF742 domain-containing protein [Thermomonospora sp. CIF 1]